MKRTLFFFTIAFFTFALEPFLPFRLFSFVPFLAIAFQRASFPKSLWMATGCGLCVDLMNTSFPLGLFALSYSLTGLFTYRFRQLFIDEHLFSIPLYTLLTSIVLSLIQAFLIHPVMKVTLSFFIATFCLMPLCDALYAFFFFTIPLFCYRYLMLRRRRRL